MPVLTRKCGLWCGARTAQVRTSEAVLYVGAGRGGWNRAQQRHLAAIAHPPVERVREIEARAAKAYIGQFSQRGDLFVAAYQDRRLRVFDTTGCAPVATPRRVLREQQDPAGTAVWCT